MSKFRAYYYEFDATGAPEIDKILEAVARAGKAYHNTCDWNDPDFDGKTPVEKIQNAANEAAGMSCGYPKQPPSQEAADALLAELQPHIERLPRCQDCNRILNVATHYCVTTPLGKRIDLCPEHFGERKKAALREECGMMMPKELR